MSFAKPTERRNDMRARLTKLGAGLAALVALAVGGSALASAANSGSQPANAPAAVQPGSAKADAVANEPAEKGDTDSIQDENGKDDASEPAEAAENEAAEGAESGSEVPGDDGPGGWADEPANPNADTQQQGEH
jgi:hypothetical protein